jgi:palmitoyltransferase ZDHHC2/15/20
MDDTRLMQPMNALFKKPKRFSEPLKLLPVAFMTGTILFLYVVYVFEHCIPRLQSDVAPEHVDSDIRSRGHAELIACNILTVALVVCYIRAIATSPGEVPDDKTWQYQEETSTMSSYLPAFLQETKKSGDRRHCKWCGKYKPDRTHHCKVCQTCVRRMDHHCPWIYNCVGYFNYKYFFLMLFYSMLDCHLITWTMVESVEKTLDYPTSFFTMFIIIFGETVAAFLAILVTLFFCFHVWLMLSAMTTIEFCEKTLPKDPKKQSDTSLFNRGPYANVCAVLGDNPICWLLPLNGPSGDGLSFAFDVDDAISPAKRLQALPPPSENVEATRKFARKSMKRLGCEDDAASETPLTQVA